jgi:hypothetical protein
MVFIELKSMNHMNHRVIQHKSYFQIPIYISFSNIQIYFSAELEERNHIHLVLLSSDGIEP